MKFWDKLKKYWGFGIEVEIDKIKREYRPEIEKIKKEKIPETQAMSLLLQKRLTDLETYSRSIGIASEVCGVGGNPDEIKIQGDQLENRIRSYAHKRKSLFGICVGVLIAITSLLIFIFR